MEKIKYQYFNIQYCIILPFCYKYQQITAINSSMIMLLHSNEESTKLISCKILTPFPLFLLTFFLALRNYALIGRKNKFRVVNIILDTLCFKK